jgi:hypothetical protein
MNTSSRICQRCGHPFVPKGRERICKICKTRCCSCGELLTPDMVNQSDIDKNHYVCKDCSNESKRETTNYVNKKDYTLRRTYGITLAEYEDMMKSQDSLCAICGKPLEVGHVDHKHQKGEKKILKEKGQALIRKNVRGLLCMACNRGLAAFRDVPELFEAAAKYLRDWPSKQVLK